MSKITLEHFDNLSNFPEIINFQTNRFGGFSGEEFKSLNLTYSVGDKPELVLQNRELLAQTLGIDIHNFVFSHQTHSTNVRIITVKDKGTGVYNSSTSILKDVDAMITNQSELMLCMKVADCLPILFYDPTKKVIGIVHAGWKGTANGITRKCIETMSEHYGCSTSDIVIGIGVGAGMCCYEVGADVFELLKQSIKNYPNQDFYRLGENNKYSIDLKLINKIQLLSMGVDPKKIEIKAECTICNNDKYFSVRAKKGSNTGRIACGIMLK